MFREINSRFGHTTGDFVLLEVATILKSAVRGSDAVIRYGGDEFLVILADAPWKMSTWSRGALRGLCRIGTKAGT